MDDTVILYIKDSGDRSVGIQPQEMEIKIYKGFIEEKDEREQFKKDACEFFKNIDFGFPIRYCYFSDECPECNTVLENLNCPNKNCIVNIANEVEQFDELASV
jgi:hypothetical protein